MKRLTALFLAALMLLPLIACGGAKEPEAPVAVVTDAPQEAAEATAEPTEAPTPEPTEEPTPEPEPAHAIGETVSTDILELTLDASQPTIALSNRWGTTGTDNWGQEVFLPKAYDASEDAENPYVAGIGHTLISFCVTMTNKDRTRLEYVSSSSNLKYRMTITYNDSTESELKYGAVRSNLETYVANSLGMVTTIQPNQWREGTILSFDVGETINGRLYFDIPTDIENLTAGYTLSFVLPNSDGTDTTFTYFVPAK